jgi:hypothetical protein
MRLEPSDPVAALAAKSLGKTRVKDIDRAMRKQYSSEDEDRLGW